MLRDYYAQHKVLPSYSTIGEMVGIRAKSAVLYMVNRLKKTGHLESTPDRRLQPGPRFFVFPLLDTVQAGSPMPANDNQPSDINVVNQLMRNPSKSIVLKVPGDSMEGVGLRNGDFVVVQPGVEPGFGDIVVAAVDDGYTIKEWAKGKSGGYLKSYYLDPAVNNLTEIHPNVSMSIYGVVTGSFRGYNPRHLR